MAITDTREIVIEASPEEILDVIADLESLPEWSPAHQSSTIVSTWDDGRPREARMKVKTAGITDEQVVAYTWEPGAVSWTLVKASQQRRQDGKYVLTPQGDKTHVAFQLTLEPLVPLPGFIVKRVAEGAMETATQGLRKQVLRTKS